MSEMLGNRYLLQLRFAEAIPHFESRLLVAPRERRTAEKLALCHALLGDRTSAKRWLRVALDSGRSEARAEDVLWNEFAEAIRHHRHELGGSRSALGLALAEMFHLHPTETTKLESTPESDPELAWLREVLLAFDRQREVPDETSH